MIVAAPGPSRARTIPRGRCRARIVAVVIAVPGLQRTRKLSRSSIDSHYTIFIAGRDRVLPSDLNTVS